MKLTVIRIILAVLLTVNLGIITYNSSLSAEKSGDVSAEVTVRINDKIESKVKLVPQEKKKTIEDMIRWYIRNYAHIAEFLPVGFLSFLLVAVGRRKFRELSAALIISVVFSALTALLDEIHQIFVDGRTFEWEDFRLDFEGAAVGILAAVVIFMTVLAVIKLIEKRKAQS